MEGELKVLRDKNHKRRKLEREKAEVQGRTKEFDAIDYVRQQQVKSTIGELMPSRTDKLSNPNPAGQNTLEPWSELINQEIMRPNRTNQASLEAELKDIKKRNMVEWSKCVQIESRSFDCGLCIQFW